MSAFLYRFSLDRQIIDLNSKIKQQESVVKLLKNNEATYRNVQDSLTLSIDLASKNTEKNDILQNILSFTPEGLKINNLIVSENRLSMSAFAQNTTSLALFTKSLKNYPKISKLNLDDIQIKPGIGLSVNFSANFQ